MQRDIQSELRVLGVDAIDVVAASVPYEVAGTEVDTKGARSVVFAFEVTEAVSTDEMYVKIYECATSGGTYTEIASDKYLDGGSKLLIDEDSGNGLLTVGCFSTERYIKPYIDADVVADDLTVNVYPILKDDIRPKDVDTVDSLP